MYVSICLVSRVRLSEASLTPGRTTRLIVDEVDVHDEFDELACN